MQENHTIGSPEVISLCQLMLVALNYRKCPAYFLKTKNRWPAKSWRQRFPPTPDFSQHPFPLPISFQIRPGKFSPDAWSCQKVRRFCLFSTRCSAGPISQGTIRANV